MRQEFEIELEGSQTLRLLCYEKSCSKIKQSKEDGEMTDRIIAKGQIKVPTQTKEEKNPGLIKSLLYTKQES